MTTVAVTVGASGDSAIEGTDYETIAELTLNILEGQTSTFQTVQFRPVNDGIDEGDESLSITGTTTAPGLTVTETALVLFDDETPRSVTLTAGAGIGGGGRRTDDGSLEGRRLIPASSSLKHR